MCKHTTIDHQTHVRMILEAPPLVEGNGKELRRLYDAVQQHFTRSESDGLRSSRTIHHFRSVLEWQRHSQDSTTVPHYNQFVNLCAQASESLPVARKGSTPLNTSTTKKPSRSHKPIAS